MALSLRSLVADCYCCCYFHKYGTSFCHRLFWFTCDFTSSSLAHHLQCFVNESSRYGDLYS